MYPKSQFLCIFIVSDISTARNKRRGERYISETAALMACMHHDGVMMHVMQYILMTLMDLHIGAGPFMGCICGIFLYVQ